MLWEIIRNLGYSPNKTDVGRTDQNVWIWQNPDIINFILILDYGRKFNAFHFWIQLIELRP